MDIKIFLFLIVATSLETAGDAIVRMGMSQTAWPLRGGLFLAGAGLLFGYGFCLNLPPVEFGRIVGLYIATLFIVWQITNFHFRRLARNAGMARRHADRVRRVDRDVLGMKRTAQTIRAWPVNLT